jgi:hypothetical protein
MTVAYFSMKDIQSVWQNGGEQAYFAARRTAPAPPLPTNPMVSAESGMKTNAGKAVQKVAVRGENGLVYYANRMKNVADRAASGTANNTGKGIKAMGSGVANAGGFVRDKANQLGGVIRSNPRTAGAIILGGTALGVAGGAYAMNQRNKSN